MKDKIQLDIPLINQPKGEDTCALAVLQMLLADLGNSIEYAELKKRVPWISEDRTGITAATAKILVEEGYEVNFTTYQLELIDEDLVGKDEKDISVFKRKVEKLEEGNVLKQWQKIIEYIEAGGKFKIALSTLGQIDKYLEKGIPARLSIAPKALHPDSKFNSHAVVVCGKKGNQYLLNDPATRFLEPYYVGREALLFAWYANGASWFVAFKK